jgi:FMN phosphatase YigB (HAD superfamily)
MWYLSFTTLIHDVHSATGVDKATLLAQSKVIHQKHGTSEYLFLLDELPAATTIPPEQREALRVKYYETREAGLVLYPTVKETLERLKNDCVKIIAFSESKKFYSAYRLAKLGLNVIVDHLYCPDDHAIPNDLEQAMMFDASRIATLPAEFKKPDPQILLRIAEREGVEVSECLYVGDSETKDIEMAQRAGMDYLWFKSGADHLTERIKEYDILREVTHWHPDAVAKERQTLTANGDTKSPRATFTASPILPDRTMRTYNEILKFF